MLRVLLKSPLTYHRTMQGQIKREPTSAMQFGTASHSAILENRFDGFYVRPETQSDGRKWRANAAECEAWIESHADRPVLTNSELVQLQAAARYVHEHPQASKLMQGATAEVSVFSEVGKARCDLLRVEPLVATVIDLKTCMDASTPAFSREILNRGYHIQAAWYRRVLMGLGIGTVHFYFIALQKGQLPLVNVLKLSEQSMRAGDAQVEAALILKRQCETNFQWPEWGDYDGTNEIKSVDVPAYALPEEELTGAEEI